MTTPTPRQSPAAVVAAATELLYERFGERLRLSSPVELSGESHATVVRVRLEPNGVLSQRTLVLKQLPAGGGEDDPLAADLLREIVCYQFTTALPAAKRPGAQLLASSVEQRLLILSDLGVGKSFDEILASPDEGYRRRNLMAFAQALGRLHAATAHREDDFHALIARAEARYPIARDLDVDQRILAGVDEAVERLRAAGLIPPDSPEADAHEITVLVREARALLTDPTLSAFVPFDLSTSNVHVADTVRFLDLEWAGFHDAAIDIAGVMAGFPLELAEHEVDPADAEALLGAWMSEIRAVWPQHATAEFLRGHLVPALVLWALLASSWFTDTEPQAGFSSSAYSAPQRRCLAATWSYVAAYAQRVGQRGVAAWATDCAAHLRGE